MSKSDLTGGCKGNDVLVFVAIIIQLHSISLIYFNNITQMKHTNMYVKIHFLTLFVPCTQSLKFVYALNFGTFLSPLATMPPVAGLRYSRASSFLQVNFPKPEIETVLSLETAWLMSGKIKEYVAHDTCACEQPMQEN